MSKTDNTALTVARLLNGSKQSPFWKQIRFDSKGMAPLPISTLCSKSVSDLGTSLVGLAKVGLSGEPQRSAEWLAACVVATVMTLQKMAPDLLDDNKVLTPPPDGTKGSATMLLGVSIALAYRMGIMNEDVPSPRAKAGLVGAAVETLSGTADACRLASRRRTLLGNFVRRFFADLSDVKKLDGIPEGLLATMSATAYGPPSGPAPEIQPQHQRPSLKEREQAALILLRDPEVAAWSDRAIGRRCGLDGKTVKKLRQQLDLDELAVKKVARQGQSYFLDTSRIGKGD